jgi:hypothetical protein
MTVSELIKILEKVPGDEIVAIEDVNGVRPVDDDWTRCYDHRNSRVSYFCLMQYGGIT